MYGSPLPAQRRDAKSLLGAMLFALGMGLATWLVLIAAVALVIRQF